MPYHATFCFLGSLNDFLSKEKKEQWIGYSFLYPPSVKDAIEAIGVPHVEIKGIKANGNAVSFEYLLQHSNCIEVFPYEEPFPEDLPKIFVLDVHLGKLARLLRMLGIDTAYQNNSHDKEIVAIALNEDRAVLTRDIGLLKYKTIKHGYWLRSQNSEEQLRKVAKRFSLLHHIYPFTRCMECNGILQAVEKNAIIQQLPPLVNEFYHEFFQCSNCQKIYWKGSHYKHMQQMIEKIKSMCTG